MRHILVRAVAVVGFGLLFLAGCAKRSPIPPGVAPDEAAEVRITMVDGQCRLLDDQFLKVWSARGRTVVWKIKGECSSVKEITVGQFTRNGQPVMPITIRHAARPVTGSTVLATVNNDAEVGMYRYIALFDGQPAEVRALGGKAGEDFGDFEVCPQWPCS